MTTTNEIRIYEYEDVLNVPLEAFYSDSIDYVIVESGGKKVKQQIIRGAINENDIIVVEGLNMGDQIVLTPPDDVDLLPYNYLDQSIADAGLSKLEIWKKAKNKYDEANESEVKGVADQNKDMESGGGMVIFR